MRLRPLPIILLKIALAALPAIALSGCGGAEEPDETAVQPPQIDPRFATAESLVNHLNAIVNGATIDPATIDEILYPENDAQRKLVDVFRLAISTLAVDREMIEQFDETFDDEAVTGLELPFESAARITSSNADRARAKAVDWLGEKWDLHLVRMANRWWISGYTFEYDPAWKDVEPEIAELLTYLTLTIPSSRRTALEMAPRVRAGEFKSAQAVRQEFMRAHMTYARAHPEEYTQLKDYLRQHPEQRAKIMKLGMDAMSQMNP